MNYEQILFYVYLTVNTVILIVYMVLFIHKAFNRFYYRRRFEDRIEESINSMMFDINQIKRKQENKTKSPDYLDSRESID